MIGSDGPPYGFLPSLDERERADLEAVGALRRYAPGTTILFEGERPAVVLAVLDGRVKITSVSENGRHHVLGIVGAGDLLGEFAAIDGGAHSASAVAVDAVTALAVGPAAFREFLGRHAAVTYRLMQDVVRRVRANDRKRIEFAAYDVMTRVARRLLELADADGSPEPGGGARTVALPLTQDELAGLVGASREQVVRVLRVLRDEGVLTTGRRTMTIVDAEGLRCRAR